MHKIIRAIRQQLYDSHVMTKSPFEHLHGEDVWDLWTKLFGSILVKVDWLQFWHAFDTCGAWGAGW